MGRNLSDHDILLRWRTQLTDFEQDTLLPQLIGRLDVLKGMFQEILKLLDVAEKDPAFIEALKKVVNPTNLKMNEKTIAPHVEYCASLRKQIPDNFLKPIESVKEVASKVQDYRTFAKFINELMVVGTSSSQNESTLFWLSMKPFAHVVNPGDERLIATTKPVEYAIILRPFEIWTKNIKQVADSIIGSVDAWAKEQSNWKTQYLAFRANESNSRNNLIVLCVNIVTVLLAVSVSLSFLFFPDVWTSKKERDQLKAEKALVEKSLEESKAKVTALEAQLNAPTKGPKKSNHLN